MISPLRILHFSDIHIGMHVRHMHWKKWFSKRGIGALNLLRGRSKYFDDAVEKMEALVRFKDANNIDLVINTGDYTSLGLKRELALARELVEPMMNAPQGYITVPGNHDIYVSEARSHRRFSEQFAKVLHSDMPEYSIDGRWPLVRLIGDNDAIIAINSVRPNPWPWRSNGIISQAELEMIDRALQDQRLQNRFIFIATHYAPRLANGEDDTPLHGLINADELLKVCRKIDRGAILCGHIHQTYRVAISELSCKVYCAGSATMSGCEGFWVYERSVDKIKAFQVSWDTKNSEFIIRH